MTSYVVNILTFSGDKQQVKSLLNLIEVKNETAIDFNKVIPMPEGLSKENKTKWMIENWGSKHNASCTASKDNSVTFDSTLFCPIPIINALVRTFPLVKVNVKFADENVIFNCGEFNVYYNFAQEKVIQEVVFVGRNNLKTQIFSDAVTEGIEFANEGEYFFNLAKKVIHDGKIHENFTETLSQIMNEFLPEVKKSVDTKGAELSLEQRKILIEFLVELDEADAFRLAGMLQKVESLPLIS